MMISIITERKQGGDPYRIKGEVAMGELTGLLFLFFLAL